MHGLTILKVYHVISSDRILYLINQTKCEIDVTVKLYTCIREESVSRLGVIIGYSDQGFCKFPQYF